MGRTRLILDSSAIIAILCHEPGCQALLGKIGSARLVVIGAPTLAETQLALTVKLSRDASALVEQFLVEAQALVVPFGREHISEFFSAYLRFGKGRFGKGRHPARLNMGDCFTYATAKVARMPVLCVGNDFALTDIAMA
jgi:ribonuclease VapC